MNSVPRLLAAVKKGRDRTRIGQGGTAPAGSGGGDGKVARLMTEDELDALYAESAAGGVGLEPPVDLAFKDAGQAPSQNSPNELEPWMVKHTTEEAGLHTLLAPHAGARSRSRTELDANAPNGTGSCTSALCLGDASARRPTLLNSRNGAQMSTSYVPLTTIKMSDLFDGRLERFNVHEHHTEESSPTFRCLTDGFNYVWVYGGDDGSVSYLERYAPNGNPRHILACIADAFSADIVSDGMIAAEIAKQLIAQNAELALPANRTRLLAEMSEIYRRSH